LIKKKGYVIWPIYFDALVSRSKCRRVPLKLAIKNPTAEQIVAAARRLGWAAEIEPGSHPAFWWKKSGKVIVKPKEPINKNEAILRIAQVLKSMPRR